VEESQRAVTAVSSSMGSMTSFVSDIVGFMKTGHLHELEKIARADGNDEKADRCKAKRIKALECQVR
jgi:hypothetical protein